MVALNVWPELQMCSPLAALYSALTPYAVGAWTVALIACLVAGRGRQRWIALLAAGGLGLQAAWMVPYLPGPERQAGEITVMTLNLRCVTNDPIQVLDAIEETAPDVVVLADIPTATLRGLTSLGFGDQYEYSFDQPTRRSRPGAVTRPCGTHIAARGPVRLLAATSSDNPQHTVLIDLPQATLHLIAVDVENIIQGRGIGPWAEDLESVRVGSAPLVDGPLVVLGDFNAVREHQPMRQLRALGLVDAAEASGAGWVRTFPAGRPLLAINHVMVGRALEPRTLRAIAVEGGDHLALVATLSLSE
ncbi:MAG TPA: endonuclease/exonuclease/phosphatase family protein [Actinomycetaceae bacterium]|nr:endonuclease/exonuclease/phosphatase family protein [Actinomycetaceae bacterium]